MALGGGTFITQNKVLPGSYINFVSVARANATLSDRGYAAMGLELDWGEEDKIFTVENSDFQRNCLKIFGYDYTDDKLKGLRDLFLNATTLYAYRLTSGGTKATNTYATAKYCGIRGNDLKVVIQKNADTEEHFDVMVYLDTQKVFEQKDVTVMSELAENDWVLWKTEASLAVTAGEKLSTGTNGTVNGAAHQKCLDLLESYSFNVLGCTSTDDTIKGLYTAYTKRMRDDVGAKFQLAVHKKPADYMGVVNVTTESTDDNHPVSSVIYWVTGALAGCAVNKSLLNTKYNGEFAINAEGTQTELEKAIKAGEFRFHKVGDDIRVLSDINSFVSVTDTEGTVFQENQTIRVCDQFAIDVSNKFNTTYLGKVPNDQDGRVALRSDIISIANQLQELRALEDFDSDDVTVEQGDSKKSVVVNVSLTPVTAMAQLYMEVRIN